jgi:hypothetical protein
VWQLTFFSEQYENQFLQRPEIAHNPDRRHLESSHKRVNGDDGLYLVDVEPYNTPLLSLPPAPTSGRPAAAVMMINVKASERGPVPVRGLTKEPLNPALNGWETVTNGSVPTMQTPKVRFWGNISSKRLAQTSRPGPTPWSSDSFNFPDLLAARSSSNDVYFQANAVKPPITWDPKEPESFVIETEDYASGHPIVSQKKKAKKAQEAKRKSKKQSTSEEVVTGDLNKDVNEEITVLAQGLSTPPEVKLDTGVLDIDKKLQSYWVDAKTGDMITEAVVEPIAIISGPISEVSPMVVTKHGKHMHWIRFLRNFVVDQLTNPSSPSWSGCSQNTSCHFENNNVPDCPFHEPRKYIIVAS